MSFKQATDIANRAIQHCGARRIALLTDLSKQATEINFCYDKLRVAELRRSVWRFATRRATIRPFTSSTRRFIPSSYAAGTTYVVGDLVQDSDGVYWQSQIPSNTGHTPGLFVTGRPQYWQQFFGTLYCDLWSATVTYNAGELVYKSGPVFYVSTGNANLNGDPASGGQWQPITGTTNISTPYYLMPVGPSFLVGAVSRNLFPLPNGFLRLAAPDPKIASGSVLATSGAVQYSDWQLESDYIVSAGTDPIVLRFVADIADVTMMDPLFCEGLSARIAYEVAETLTQSNVKLQAIAAAYQKFIKDARLINVIEIGSSEPEEQEMQLTRGPQGVVDGVPAMGGGQPQDTGGNAP